MHGSDGLYFGFNFLNSSARLGASAMSQQQTLLDRVGHELSGNVFPAATIFGYV